jgi:hypothetical protein
MNAATDLRLAPLGDPDPLARLDLFRATRSWAVPVGSISIRWC